MCDFQHCYEYLRYSDLRHFLRIYPVPKRCAAYTPGGISCEYYTVPRLVKDKVPAGYTSYTAHTVYDVNQAHELVRVSVRVPRYKDTYGNICIEDFGCIKSKYTHDALNLLHQKFCNPAYLFDDLSNDFPLGKNASKKAYELLLPWAQKNRVFPEYPYSFSFLQFIDIPYKKSTLTFCLTCSENEEPSLFDILIDDNFDQLASLKTLREDPLYICLGSNNKLYQTLHSHFPNAIYVFNPFSLIATLEQCASNIPDDKQIFLSRRSEIVDTMKKLCLNHYPAERIAPIYESAIKFLLNYPSTRNMQTDILDAFRNNLQSIARQQPDFISSKKYCEQTAFHSFAIFQLQKAIKLFSKSKGYETTRLVYMLLSSIKDLPYVETRKFYCLPPDFFTDEVCEKIEEESERIMCNSFISSIVERINWMSTGEFVE